MTRVPNFDAMSAEELWAFWRRTEQGQRLKLARQMFPTRPKLFTQTFRDLGHYAANKATAMMEREKGNIETALGYERICERIYRGLPDYAKW